MKIIKEMWSLLSTEQKVITTVFILAIEMWLLIMPWSVH